MTTLSRNVPHLPEWPPWFSMLLSSLLNSGSVEAFSGNPPYCISVSFPYLPFSTAFVLFFYLLTVITFYPPFCCHLSLSTKGKFQKGRGFHFLVSLIIVCIAWQGAAIQKILMKTNDKTYV
jgi:hypothetical protein